LATVEELNDAFGLDGHLRFEPGVNGLTRAVIDNAHARARVYLHGAHVTAYEPVTDRPVLWLSDRARYRPGAAIRGGIPVCWPWFGPHPSDADKPQHGFARLCSWRVTDTAVLGDGGTRIALGLSDDDARRAVWPHRFELALTVTVGRALSVELSARNTGNDPFSCTGALHTYLAVADVEQARVCGLDGTDYIDKLDGDARKTQRGDVVVSGAVDCIYLSAPPLRLLDRPGRRRIRISATGSGTTVVWNPWRELAAAMDDVPDDGYRRMLCVEAANARHDARSVAPGQVHTLSQTIAVDDE
jgi:glucose-6-phosphate 1-epimerase